MVSNFGGDGGDVLVDPNDGCNIVQEYVYLSMRVTQTCANPGPDHPNAFLDLSQCDDDRHRAAGHQRAVHRAVHGERRRTSTSGSPAATASGSRTRASPSAPARSGRRSTRSPTAGQTFTAVAYSGNRRVRDLVRPVRTAPRLHPRRCRRHLRRRHVDVQAGRVRRPTSRTATSRARRSTRRTRTTCSSGVNGFSRRFTEGPGAGIGHIFESNDGGLTWTDISGNFPDVPVNDVVVAARAAVSSSAPTSASSTARRRRATLAAARQPACRSRSRWTSSSAPTATSTPRRTAAASGASRPPASRPRRYHCSSKRAASGRPAVVFAVDISGVSCDDRHALAGRCRESAGKAAEEVETPSLIRAPALRRGGGPRLP